MEVKPGYKQTEVGVIPEEWKVLNLEASARVVDSLHQTPQFFDDGYPMVRVTDIKAGDLNLAETFKVSRAIYEEFVRNYKPKRGDIVLSRVGSYGVSSFVETDEPFCMGQNTVVLQPKVPARLLYYVLNSRGIRQQIEDGSYGSGYKSLSLKNIKELRIPLPPSEPEQRAIATALSDVDALLGALDRLIAKKCDLKQAAMQQLLTGQTRLPGFHGEWEVKRLGELVQLSKAGINPSSTPETLFTHFSLPAFDASETPVVETGACIGSNKFVVPQNAVLLSKLNPRIPRIWAPLEIPINSVCSTEFLVLKPNADLDRTFLKCVCLSPGVCSKMELHAIGTTGSHQRIQPNQAMAIEVAIPADPNEQTAIAGVLSEMDAELAVLEQRQAKTRALKQGMMQELLTGRTRLI